MKREKIIAFCDKVIEWCFYTLLVTIAFSTSLVEIASSVMIIAWVIKKLNDRDWTFLRSTPVKMLIIYFIWVMLSCINSEYFNESFRGILKVAEYSMLFIISATMIVNKNSVKKFFYVIAAGSIVICLNGFVQYFTGTGVIRHRTLVEDDYLHRISSSFVHSNDYGVYLLVIVMISVAFILSRNSKVREKVAAVVPAVLSIISLYLTKSRGAWISFTGAFLVFGAMKAKKVLAVFVAILLVVFMMLPYVAKERIFSLTDFKSGTTWERVMLWKGTINMISVHPVLGFGINTYSRNFPKYRPAGYSDARYTHNSYLHMASEVGIVGALLFLTFLVTVLLLSLRNLSLLPPGRRKDLIVGLFAGLVGFSMSCIVDTHLYSVNLAVFFHILLGFCYALSCYSDEK